MTDTILVTGGTGRVGRRVTQQLREKGYAVRVFDLPNMDYTGLEGEVGIEVLRGDIAQAASVEQAVLGVNTVVHLAALLPPASEKSRELTFAVNVGGVNRIVEALKQDNPHAFLVFSSSVSTYGDTTGMTSLLAATQPQQALDIYAESKIAAEEFLRNNYSNSVVLRISGISVPSIQNPPEVWPFTVDQRIEFIHRDDVVTALCAAVGTKKAKGKVFNIAGGVTWQTTGRAYVKDYYDLLGVPIEEARFQESPGWCDWYDTEDSQQLLLYQNTSYQKYLGQLKDEIGKKMQG